MDGNAPAYFIYRKNVGAARLRRCFDVVIAMSTLLASCPILALGAVAILLDDGLPIFYGQLRAGQYERVFTMWKLRTMSVHACGDGPSPSSSRDPRITRVGRTLRKLSIDELPQLFNVMRGEMSLVGPRPEMPFMIARYERWQHLRHLVRPGLTCFWQVRLRSNVPLNRPEATALDIEYIRTASPQIDSLLLAQTALALMRPKGAY